jgi:hypothetical protein
LPRAIAARRGFCIWDAVDTAVADFEPAITAAEVRTPLTGADFPISTHMFRTLLTPKPIAGSRLTTHDFRAVTIGWKKPLSSGSCQWIPASGKPAWRRAATRSGGRSAR